MSETKGDGTNEGALWGARFATGPSPELAALSRSTHFDWDLALYDIAGSHAHAKALAAAGYLDRRRGATRCTRGSTPSRAGIADGTLRPDPDDEDVHGALESALIDTVGAELGGKLRAGRSRNDQIATLVRMYLLDHSANDRARHPPSSSMRSSRRPRRIPTAIMPGRTHLQHAQPVLLAHHLHAHAWPLVRDLERLRDWSVPRVRVAVRRGSAGGLDARSRPGSSSRSELGLARPAENSIDGTSARDVVAEFAFITAQLGIDLSRFAEEIILWNTREFGFVTLDDGYSTGSCIMPQKKNPDIAELARGKAGRLIGNLTGLLATLKGLPLAYNRDLQEDKEPVFDSIATLEVLLPAFAGMVATLRFDTERMADARPAGLLPRDGCRRLARAPRRALPRRARDLRRARAALRGARARTLGGDRRRCSPPCRRT